jgi:hypothetical protein
VSLTLKPCPFCGGEAEQRPVRDGTKTRCKRCSADVVAYNGPGDPGGRIRSAEQWNRRQDSSSERAEGRPSPEDMACGVLPPRHDPQCVSAGPCLLPEHHDGPHVCDTRDGRRAWQSDDDCDFLTAASPGPRPNEQRERQPIAAGQSQIPRIVGGRSAGATQRPKRFSPLSKNTTWRS